MKLRLATLAERPKESAAALRKAIERNWNGFEWRWLDKEKAEDAASATPERQPKSTAWSKTYDRQRPNINDPNFKPY